jgi:AbrB family looped-hinge helix DNA binding protein
VFTKISYGKEFRKKDSFSFTAISDERGRIIIPVFIRKKLGLRFGSKVEATVRGDYK